MDFVTLGRTGIKVNKNGFGALPIQRISTEDAVYLLRKAFEGGITFFDTARAYSDSEEKVGIAFEFIREKLYIATKTAAIDAAGFKKDLETSLRLLKTDYIDIYQFHNPSFCPKPGDGSGLYEAALEAKREGKIKHIGITNHRLNVAREAIESGLYDTLQFPFSYISGDAELELVKACKEHDMGFIAMKGLSGGLLSNYESCYAFASQFDNVLPIWGIQREKELNQWLKCVENPPRMNMEIEDEIARDRRMLSGEFCRGCGYCMPCTVGIEINNLARMSLMMRRSPSEQYFTPEWKEKIFKIKDCIDCGLCKSKCPYGLDTPELLRRNLEDYENVLANGVDTILTKDSRT